MSLATRFLSWFGWLPLRALNSFLATECMCRSGCMHAVLIVTGRIHACVISCAISVLRLLCAVCCEGVKGGTGCPIAPHSISSTFQSLHRTGSSLSHSCGIASLCVIVWDSRVTVWAGQHLLTPSCFIETRAEIVFHAAPAARFDTCRSEKLA